MKGTLTQIVTFTAQRLQVRNTLVHEVTCLCPNALVVNCPNEKTYWVYLTSELVANQFVRDIENTDKDEELILDADVDIYMEPTVEEVADLTMDD